MSWRNTGSGCARIEGPESRVQSQTRTQRTMGMHSGECGVRSAREMSHRSARIGADFVDDAPGREAVRRVYSRRDRRIPSW